MKYFRELELAVNLAVKGGLLAKKIQASFFKIHIKPDGMGPVTEADQALNDMIVHGIESSFPEDGILAEESENPRNMSSDRLWCIDPIDGTKEFVRRNAEWSVMIGLAVNDESVMGVVYQPETGRIGFGVKGEGAYRSDIILTEEISIKNLMSNAKSLQANVKSDSGLTMVDSHYPSETRRNFLINKFDVAHSYRYGSVGLKFLEISEGKADFYLNDSGKCFLWDTCAGHVLLNEAGGHAMDGSGREIHYNPDKARIDRPYAATSARARDHLLRNWV